MILRILRKVSYLVIKIVSYWVNYFIIKNLDIKIENNVKINGFPYFINNGKFKIEENVRINSGLRYNPIGGMRYCSFVVKKGAKLYIGRGSGISNSSIVCTNRIIICDNVSIGGNVKIYDTDFHSIDYVSRVKGAQHDSEIKSRPIEIGDGAFIGASTIILKGVTIGCKSVIGAGSVVTKSIPENQIWAGNPIKFIRNI